MRILVAFIFILASTTAIAQLREFEVSKKDDPGTHVVQANADFPDDAILLIYSTFDDLRFRSSMSVIDKVTYNTASGRYEILIQPLKQLIFVNADDFIETKVGTVSPTSKQVIYYEVSEKLRSTISQHGTIDVQSDPGDASIFINDIETVYRTPSHPQIVAGTYEISLRKPTYVPFDTVIRITPGERITMMAKMTPSWAEVSITSDPSDAMVSIGNITGVGSIDLKGALKGLTPGIYTLKIERSGYRRYIESFDLVAGQRLRLAPVLTPILGKLEVITEPPGASVSLSGKSIGVSPLQIDAVIGNHMLQVEKEGYGSLEFPIVIEENQTKTINKTLLRGRQLTFNSIPSDAQLHIDGRAMGRTPRSVVLSFGTHKVELYHESERHIETIDVRDENIADTTFTYDIRKAVPIKITSFPSGAKIYLDDEYRGVTPLTIYAKTGEARLELTKAGRWNDVEGTINVQEGARFDIKLTQSSEWKEKRNALLGTLYNGGLKSEIFKGSLQLMSRGGRRYVVLPSLAKLTVYSRKFARGDSPSGVYASLGSLSDTQFNPHFLYYEVLSASLGVVFANPAHTFRWFMEGRFGQSYEWNYNPELVTYKHRAVSPWLIDNGTGRIDFSQNQAKKIPTPVTLKIGMDIHLAGKVFFQASAGVMFRNRVARWYYTDDVKPMSSGDPQPITSKSLPKWPVERADGFFAIGIRF